MSTAREIRRRIRSINNTKKITKAMELVSAAKMRKAVNRTLASREYALSSWQVLANLSGRVEKIQSPLLRERAKVKKIGVVVVSSNRGLCGGFNSKIVEAGLKRRQKAAAEGVQVEFITFGKKARDGFLKAGAALAADFEKADITRDILKIIPIVQLLKEDFTNGKYDRVEMLYTDFISTLTQRANIKQLLPLDSKMDILEAIKESLGLKTGSPMAKEAGAAASQEAPAEYLFEPSPEAILAVLLPRIIEMQIYQAVLESEASEHSARMLAMRNASDAAGEIIDDLTLTYNQARQAGITREIAEISAGKIALEA